MVVVLGLERFQRAGWLDWRKNSSGRRSGMTICGNGSRLISASLTFSNSLLKLSTTCSI